MAVIKRKRHPGRTAARRPRTLRQPSNALARELRRLRALDPAVAATEYWQLYAAASVIWIMLDEHAIIRDINPAGAQTLGVSSKFAIGTPLRMWIDESERSLALEHVRRCRSGEDPVETELSLRPNEGRVRRVRLSSRTMKFRGRLVFPTVLVDITEQEFLDRARRHAEEQRDRAEAERLTAQAAEAAKDRLIATVSHELRNPLSPALVAATTLAAMPDLPEAARHMARTIKRNVEIEARLIDDLLDIARTTRGQMVLHRATVDLHELLGYAVEASEPAARARHITITLDRKAEAHHVDADAARLQQVFWNLLNNAIKFSAPGGRVVVRTRDEAEGAAVRATVQDFGAGMDAGTVERLFSPFEHPSAPSGGSPGLGLGLTIARSIIEQHGGFVWASSKGPGRGAIFDVDLATVAPTGLAGPANATPARRPETHERCRVLLVEDHEDTSELVALSLRQEGYEVHVAASLAEGLAALDLAWDAVVSDIGLQDGSGLEIARRVGQLDASRRPASVVALTGYGADADIAASRAAGFDTHLVKPVDLGQLLQVLRDRRDARVV